MLRAVGTGLVAAVVQSRVHELILVRCMILCRYLLQEGYVIVVVCLLATLRKNVPTDLHEIFRVGWLWASEQMIKFWWRSGSRIRM